MSGVACEGMMAQAFALEPVGRVIHISDIGDIEGVYACIYMYLIYMHIYVYIYIKAT